MNNYITKMKHHKTGGYRVESFALKWIAQNMIFLTACAKWLKFHV